jgi:uncharacterized protein YndB with AHSA1/START domain
MTHALSVTAPEGLPYIDTSRDFDAPVAAVFDAHRDPEKLKRWMGPDDLSVEIPELDFRTHGGWRMVHRDAEGNEYAFHGTFHTVRENDLAVQTFEFEGAPDQVSIEFLTFTDLGGGRTRLSAHAVYPSLEARDAMVASGMETGMVEGYRKLDGVLATAAAR